MNIFISWSGKQSEEIAKKFDNFLKSVVQTATTFFSVNDIKKGDFWRKKLHEGLDKSSAGIFVLTSENLNSQWLMYEAGIISSHFLNHNIFPILFTDNIAHKETGPLSDFQITKFEKEDIKKLVFDLIEKHDGKLSHEDYLRKEEVFSVLWPKFHRSVRKIKETIQYTSDFNKITLGQNLNPSYSSVLKSISNQLNTTGKSIKNDELNNILLGIYKNLYDSRFHTAPPIDDDTLSYVFYKEIRFELDSCKKNIDRINKGSVGIYQEKVRNFWRDKIMRRIQISLWTTNISPFEGSFGRTNNPDLIKAQAEAIKQRNVKITRVFIYDPRGSEDFNLLKELMKAQINIGIEVRAIPIRVFKEIKGYFPTPIHSEDFMILDNKWLYLTNTDEERVTSTELIGDSWYVDPGIEYSKEIHRQSFLLTLENIEDKIVKI